METTALHSTRVLTSSGLEEATVVFETEGITSVVSGPISEKTPIPEDLGSSVIMPGLMDSHVHINEPGRTDWEGFNTATLAAAAGGITTLMDMPLNSSPVTTIVPSLEAKLEAAKEHLHVNCGFYGGIVPDNFAHLEGLIESGVMGIKAFLTPSGIDDFPNVTEHHLDRALPLLKKLNSTLLVHAELDAPYDDQSLLESSPSSYSAYLKSRPRSWEDNAIQLMIALCEKHGAHIHIVHLSSSNSIAPLKAAIRMGLPISVETCPHYLVFSAEEIADGQTLYKCAPPIRENENREKLWKAVKEGVISFIVTDHSPALPSMKEMESGNFKKAWGGIAGLQFSLPAIWTEAKKKHFSIQDISKLMSYNVAKFLQLDTRKGTLAKGFDADLVVWNPDETFLVTRECIQHKHKISPYVGMTLSGVVERTYVNGNLVFKEGGFPGLNKGKLLLKK